MDCSGGSADCSACVHTYDVSVTFSFRVPSLISVATEHLPTRTLRPTLSSGSTWTHSSLASIPSMGMTFCIVAGSSAKFKLAPRLTCFS